MASKKVKLMASNRMVLPLALLIDDLKDDGRVDGLAYDGQADGLEDGSADDFEGGTAEFEGAGMPNAT